MIKHGDIYCPACQEVAEPDGLQFNMIIRRVCPFCGCIFKVTTNILLSKTLGIPGEKYNEDYGKDTGNSGAE